MTVAFAPAVVFVVVGIKPKSACIPQPRLMPPYSLHHFNENLAIPCGLLIKRSKAVFNFHKPIVAGRKAHTSLSSSGSGDNHCRLVHVHLVRPDRAMGTDGLKLAVRTVTASCRKAVANYQEGEAGTVDVALAAARRLPSALSMSM